MRRSSLGAFVIGFILALAPLRGQAPARPQPPPGPPGTDIYLLSVDGALESVTRAKPVAIAIDRGYDNQPAFSADGSTVLFTANRDGKQTDAWAWDRATQKARALWSTPEAEYSPAQRADGTYSVIRVEADTTQRLWRFDKDGRNPQLILTDIKPVGYQAWVDEDLVGLFVLGQPSTLQIAKVSTGKAEVVAQGIGRSLHRVPGARALSFVHREGDDHWVKQIDADSRRIESLIKLPPESEERDVAWTPDGQTLLFSAGTRIHRWKRGEKEWTLLLDVATLNLGNVTRMAVAPKGDAIAIVVSEPKR